MFNQNLKIGFQEQTQKKSIFGSKITLAAALLPLFLGIFSACSKPKNCFSSRCELADCPAEIWQTTCPPGTKMIRENHFFDATEISNLDYREFLYWTAFVFGHRSERLFAALPDTAVWNFDRLEDSTAAAVAAKYSFSESYFRHPGFGNYPVVGLTVEQVESYAKWRSDRVFEMNLIRAGLIQPNPRQDSLMHFSIENYQNGSYLGIRPVKKIPFPVYRLPSVKEWEDAAAGGLDLEKSPNGFDVSSRKVSRHLKKGKKLFAAKEGCQNNRLMVFSKNAFFPNQSGLFNMVGNVAEMTSEKGVAKGGSWHHPLDSCRIDRHQNYSKTEAWLGFRLVCRWEFSI